MAGLALLSWTTGFKVQRLPCSNPRKPKNIKHQRGACLAELDLHFLVRNRERLLVGLQRFGLLGRACFPVGMPRARILLCIQVQIYLHLSPEVGWEVRLSQAICSFSSCLELCSSCGRK